MRQKVRFNLYGSVHRKYIPIYIQQDATLHSLYTRSDSKVMRLIFLWLYWQYCSPLTQPLTLILPLSPLAVGWLCNDSLWSRCLTCQDVFANLVTKMEARNTAQWYAIFICVKLGDSATTTHGKLQQAFGDDAMSRAQAFRWNRCFLKAEPLLKMSSAADDHQQHGQVTTRHEFENLFDPIED